jgi:hypothetical protein
MFVLVCQITCCYVSENGNLQNVMRISNLTLFARSTNLDVQEHPKGDAAVGMSLHPEHLRHSWKKMPQKYSYV